MQLSNIYSCLLTVKFDYAIDNSAGKWSTPQETYKLSTKRLGGGSEANYPFKVVDTRVRVRGTGRVAVMRYESFPGKDFEIIGRITPFTFETEG